jgi:hypothetical protein
LIPLNDRCLIRRIEEPEQRIGSIIVPDIAKSRAIKGEIVAVGPGKWHPGEWWWFDKYVATGPSKMYLWIGSDDWNEDGWQWIDGWLEPPSVFPGQICFFNSRWHDLGEQYQENKDPLWDDKMHLVMQGDIFCVVHSC